ncbi:MAG: 5-(carboxyamino)imidazole ribonucleotide synthase [Pseudomonadota bacterium]
MPLPAGAVIGILGGGQLGRMTALAAARLGYRCHILCPEPDAPATQVTDRHLAAGYEDRAALDHFADVVDVVTYEFENIPLGAVRYLAEKRPMYPGPDVLAVCQDRLLEKDFVRAAGIETAPYRAVDGIKDLAQALRDLGAPAVLKSRRLGYDGKGQVRIDDPGQAEAAWSSIGGVPAILEGFVPFVAELSVIAARDAAGTIACFPVAENQHENHILAVSTAPAPRSAPVCRRAEEIGRTLADRFDSVGLLAVELFLTDDDGLLVNEMAPRPHNSGHWTQDGCATDQFEQLVRCVTGQPLGPVDVLWPTEMENLLGDAVDRAPSLLSDPRARLHLYGKAEARPGRKMGHVNRRLSD